MNLKDIKKILVYTILIGDCVGMLSTGALAEGDGYLGVPSIPIASGTKLLAAGTGMADDIEPGVININVPTGATVEQVLLYWVGRTDSGAGDDTINVSGNSVTGTDVGAPNIEGNAAEAYGFRADITGLGLVSAGSNTLTIEEMEFTKPGRDDGVSVLVIIRDGPVDGFIEIRDGLDWAYWARTGSLAVTTKQTFTFISESVDRSADLTLVLGDGTENRPDRIDISIGSTTTSYYDEARGRDGPEWDTIIRDIVIPAGVTDVSVQLFSDNIPGNNSDSLSWIAAALSIDPLPPAPGTGTPGYWKNHPDAWPVDEIMIGGITYSKSDAIGIMGQSVKGNKTLTMFPALVSAKLNVLIGNPYSCVADTITEADTWMAANSGTKVKGSSEAWKEGESLYTELDDYNNGLLCAPHRD